MGISEKRTRGNAIPDPQTPGTPDPYRTAPDPHRVAIEDSIDLHAFTPRDIPSVVDEYLRAAHEAGLRAVRLIHGRGIGVQRARVQQVLRDHPLVASFADAPESHLGATVVKLSDVEAGL